MKIQCIDRMGAPQNTFLVKIRQHTILLNCPLESTALSAFARPATQPLYPQPPSSINTLSSILSSYDETRKSANDTNYSLASSQLDNCEDRCVFRIADFSLVDVHSIDLVIIANSQLMLGLPFLTEYLGYKGKIIATEPTIEFARYRMEELVSYHGHSITSIAPKSSTHFSQLGAMGQSCIEQGWRSLYTMKEIASCIEKIQPVRFTETLTLFSTLRLEAHSSGHSLGSANWLLETSYKKIVFLSSSSLVTGLHPLDFDTSVLKNADVIHVSDLTNQSHLDLSFQRSKAKMMSYIGRALQARGNVLFPIPTMGIIFDLIGEIRNYLLSVGVEIGHETHQIPIYMVGPMANRSLQYANICGEWMTPELQEQLYVPKMPLPHGLLLKSGGLQAVGSISLDVKAKKDFKEPCIVFTGDYACPTNGPVSWFLKKWGNSEHNVCIVVDPEVPSFDVPLGCRMTVLRAPLDTRITLTEVGRLLTMNWMRKLDGSPRHIIIPKCQGATQFQEDWRQKGADVHIYTSGDILDVDLKRKWDKVTISEKVGNSLQLSQLEPQAPGSASYLLPISGSLHLHNNQLVLGDMNSGPSTRAITLADNRTPIQPVDAISIMKRLKESGIEYAALRLVRDHLGNQKIILPSYMEASIVFEPNQTTILADDPEVRELLSAVVRGTIPNI